jgi:hypothetical protein
MLLDKDEIYENVETSQDDLVRWPDCSKNLLSVNPANYEKKYITELIQFTVRRQNKIKKKTPRETKKFYFVKLDITAEMRSSKYSAVPSKNLLNKMQTYVTSKLQEYGLLRCDILKENFLNIHRR